MSFWAQMWNSRQRCRHSLWKRINKKREGKVFNTFTIGNKIICVYAEFDSQIIQYLTINLSNQDIFIIIKHNNNVISFILLHLFHLHGAQCYNKQFPSHITLVTSAYQNCMCWWMNNPAIAAYLFNFSDPGDTS